MKKLLFLLLFLLPIVLFAQKPIYGNLEVYGKVKITDSLRLMKFGGFDEAYPILLKLNHDGNIDTIGMDSLSASILQDFNITNTSTFDSVIYYEDGQIKKGLLSMGETDPVWISDSTDYLHRSDTNRKVASRYWVLMRGFLTGNQLITLSGDVSGAGSTAITTVVADDSHNHNSSTLNDTARVSTLGDRMYGKYYLRGLETATDQDSALVMENGYIKRKVITAGTGGTTDSLYVKYGVGLVGATGWKNNGDTIRIDTTTTSPAMDSILVIFGAVTSETGWYGNRDTLYIDTTSYHYYDTTYIIVSDTTNDSLYWALYAVGGDTALAPYPYTRKVVLGGNAPGNSAPLFIPNALSLQKSTIEGVKEFGNTVVGWANGSPLTTTFSSNLLYNTVVGTDAMKYLTEGEFNTIVGARVMKVSLLGSHNTVMGEASAYNMLGDYNTIFGCYTGGSVTGDDNVIVGSHSVTAAFSGDKNTVIGNKNALGMNISNNNVIIGYGAGNNVLNSWQNIYIGYQAGSGSKSREADKLYIENSSADKFSALIYGDFADDSLIVNGTLAIGTPGASRVYSFPDTAGLDEQLLIYNSVSRQLQWYTLPGGLVNYWKRTGTIVYPNTISDYVSIGSSTMPTGTGKFYVKDYLKFLDTKFSTAFGNNALNVNDLSADVTKGVDNTGVGYYSLKSNTTGRDNTATGFYSQYGGTTGSYNTSYGSNALKGNTTGIQNTVIGANAMGGSVASIGGSNTVIGAYAGENVIGSGNIFLGNEAARNILSTSIANQLFIDSRSGNKFNVFLWGDMSEDTLVANAFLGVGKTAGAGRAYFFPRTKGTSGQTMAVPVSGNVLEWNDASNYWTLGSGTLDPKYSLGITKIHVANYINFDDAKYSTALGYQNLGFNVAINNTAIGSQSMIFNTTGSHNTAIGRESLISNVSGEFNTVMGCYTLTDNTGGGYNTVIGSHAMAGGAGSNNTVLGVYAGQSVVGNGNILIGSEVIKYDFLEPTALNEEFYLDNHTVDKFKSFLWGDLSYDTLVTNTTFGIGDVDGNRAYFFPRVPGSPKDKLVFPESGNLLEWKNESVLNQPDTFMVVLCDGCTPDTGWYFSGDTLMVDTAGRVCDTSYYNNGLLIVCDDTIEVNWSQHWQKSVANGITRIYVNDNYTSVGIGTLGSGQAKLSLTTSPNNSVGMLISNADKTGIQISGSGIGLKVFGSGNDANYPVTIMGSGTATTLNVLKVGTSSGYPVSLIQRSISGTDDIEEPLLKLVDNSSTSGYRDYMMLEAKTGASQDTTVFSVDNLGNARFRRGVTVGNGTGGWDITTSNGDYGQVLKTDGDGASYWADEGAGTKPDTLYFMYCDGCTSDTGWLMSGDTIKIDTNGRVCIGIDTLIGDTLFICGDTIIANWNGYWAKLVNGSRTTVNLINNSYNVGIGYSDAEHKLKVNGNIFANGAIHSEGGFGDVDGNGFVNANDALIVNGYLAGTYPWINGLMEADLSGNGNISAFEGYLMAKIFQGQITIANAKLLGRYLDGTIGSPTVDSSYAIFKGLEVYKNKSPQATKNYNGYTLHVNNDIIGCDSSVVVTSAGKVGIGTCSPSEEVDIVGTLKSDTIIADYINVLNVSSQPEVLFWDYCRGCTPDTGWLIVGDTIKIDTLGRVCSEGGRVNGDTLFICTDTIVTGWNGYWMKTTSGVSLSNNDWHVGIGNLPSSAYELSVTGSQKIYGGALRIQTAESNVPYGILSVTTTPPGYATPTAGTFAQQPTTNTSYSTVLIDRTASGTNHITNTILTLQDGSTTSGTIGGYFINATKGGNKFNVDMDGDGYFAGSVTADNFIQSSRGVFDSLEVSTIGPLNLGKKIAVDTITGYSHAGSYVIFRGDSVKIDADTLIIDPDSALMIRDLIDIPNTDGVLTYDQGLSQVGFKSYADIFNLDSLENINTTGKGDNNILYWDAGTSTWRDTVNVTAIGDTIGSYNNCIAKAYLDTISGCSPVVFSSGLDVKYDADDVVLSVTNTRESNNHPKSGIVLSSIGDSSQTYIKFGRGNHYDYETAKLVYHFNGTAMGGFLDYVCPSDEGMKHFTIFGNGALGLGDVDTSDYIAEGGSTGLTTLMINGGIDIKGLSLVTIDTVLSYSPYTGQVNYRKITTGSTLSVDSIPFTKHDNRVYLRTLTDSVGIGTNTPRARLEIKGTSANDLPVYGAELLTSAGWTVPGDWTESPDDVFAHGSGTGVLQHSATIVGANKYQISWTITNRTTGSITVAVGSQSLSSVTATGTFGPTAGTTTAFKITPTTDFNGTVSLVSLKVITAVSTPIAIYSSSGGTEKLEFRQNSALGNQAIGNGAGGYLTTGTGNSFSGYEAGKVNTTGTNNTATGYQALNSNTSGNQNTANGYRVLYSNTSGTNNTATGYQALNSNTTGAFNTATGYHALNSNTSGAYNTANGYQALVSNTSGAYNTANGYQALYANTTGRQNIGIGTNAGYTNTTSWWNVAIGDSALRLSTGEGNVAIGSLAASTQAAVTGTVAIGHEALKNGTGSYNTAIGYQGLKTTIAGQYNTALGYQAGFSNTSGSSSLFLGQVAGYNNTASENIYIGNGSGYSNVSGLRNTYLGFQVGYYTTGEDNCIMGYRAGGYGAGSVFGGAKNTSIGSQSLYSIRAGFGNTVAGYQAGYLLQSGQNNSFYGNNSGGNPQQQTTILFTEHILGMKIHQEQVMCV